MALSVDEKRIRRIEKRFFDAQKISDSDVRWLTQRSKRLLIADAILTDRGYVLDFTETGYQLPIQEHM